MSRARDRADSGISLVEVCGATVVVGVVTAVALASADGLIDRQGQRAGAADVASVLRGAHQQAIVDEGAMCVAFDLVAQTYSVLRGSCGSASATTVRGPLRLAAGLRLDSAAFTAGADTVAAVTFRADGSATPGSVRVSREGDSRPQVVVVDGATGAVT